ncbi:UDP-glucose iridoid glucosyltransferase-like [Pistacia vera]|uniref:UDP-glucose iridoid glucosyltransferase-like n=1 Tax=Pistacia vera TaxID=55513 RepID=UPI001263D696|nr:UDP-glucose iridoid glucosyltransferase-like [Pistacia vera]
MLNLGSILHSKGFSITIAHTQFNSPKPSDNPDFVFLPISDGLSYSDLSSKGIVDFISCLNINCKEPLLESLTPMIDEKQQLKELPCIIYDEYMYFAEQVAHLLKLPSVILSTGSAANLLTYYAFPRLQKDGFIPFQDDMALDMVPELHPFRFKDLPFRFKDLPGASSENLDALSKLIASARDTRSSSAMILNSMEFLEQSSLIQLKQQCRIPLFSIGPMHKIASASSSSLLEEDSSCISWLNKQGHNSVIYVSFGSIASVDAKELTEMAWGIANSKQPFLWVIRPDPDNGAEPTDWLPDEFKVTLGERGYIVKWAPQQEVLAHTAVGGFWSHCGWNSTIESISEGVPMICRPCFGDQKVNTRYISHVWRNGFELENDLERGKIERAIKRLMVEKEGEEMRQKAVELKEKTEVSIKKGGSSYNSLNELVELITSV